MIWIFIAFIIAILLAIIWSSMTLADRTDQQNDKMVAAYNSASIPTQPPTHTIPASLDIHTIWFESTEVVNDWLYQFGFRSGPGTYKGSWLAGNEYFQMGQKDRGGNAE